MPTGIGQNGWEDRIIETAKMDPRTLTPNPLNWRTHPPEQVAVLAGILGEVGEVAPVIWNRRTKRLIDGHLRREVAIAANQPTINVAIVDLEEAEERKVLLAFDPVTSLAEMDNALMRSLADSVTFEDDAVRAMVESMLAEMPVTDDGEQNTSSDADPSDLGGPDDRDRERLKEKWRTQLGQVWRIESKEATGAHVVVCGDALDPAVVKLLMRGNTASLLMTSPPYWANQAYDTPSTEDDIKSFMRRFSTVWRDQVTRRIVIQTGSTTTTAAAGHGDQGTGEKIKSAPFAKVWLDALWSAELASVGWLARYRRFWLKSGLMLHPGPISDLINEGVETMVCFYRPGHNEGGQERVDEEWALAGWWELPGVRGDGHPCPFNPEIPRRNILLYSRAGEIVVDPFLGQGTTIEMCEATGRLGRGIEKDPGYLAVALERFSLMGLTPTLVVGEPSPLVPATVRPA